MSNETVYKNEILIEQPDLSISLQNHLKHELTIRITSLVKSKINHHFVNNFEKNCSANI